MRVLTSTTTPARSLRVAALAVVLAVCAPSSWAQAGAGTPAAPRSATGSASSGSFHGTQSATEQPAPSTSGGPQSALLCQFLQYGDNPHISSSAPRTVSAHGWWENIDCKATKAVVTIQLQRKNSLGLWFNIGTEGKKTVYSGGGSANRANSRYICNGTSSSQFRARVDVDVVGVADAPNRTYSSSFTLACG